MKIVKKKLIITKGEEQSENFKMTLFYFL